MTSPDDKSTQDDESSQGRESRIFFCIAKYRNEKSMQKTNAYK